MWVHWSAGAHLRHNRMMARFPLLLVVPLMLLGSAIACDGFGSVACDDDVDCGDGGVCGSEGFCLAGEGEGVTAEEMEAYRMTKARADDPMLAFKGKQKDGEQGAGGGGYDYV